MTPRRWKSGWLHSRKAQEYNFIMISGTIGNSRSSWRTSTRTIPISRAFNSWKPMASRSRNIRMGITWYGDNLPGFHPDTPYSCANAVVFFREAVTIRFFLSVLSMSSVASSFFEWFIAPGNTVARPRCSLSRFSRISHRRFAWLSSPR